jgi:phosphohistidine phosphatase
MAADIMEVYLLRHAIAVERGTPGYPNDDRPLTSEGIEKMKAAAKGIARVVKDFDIIYSSPLIRARETAAIAAEATGCLDKIEICEQLLPDARMAETQKCLFKSRDAERVLLVGHEPHMSVFAAHLLGGRPANVEFKKGALCRIDIHRPPTSVPGVLVFHLQPKILRLLAGTVKKPRMI